VYPFISCRNCRFRKKEENENNVIKSIDFSLEAQAKQGGKFSHKNSRKWVVAIAYDSCSEAEFFFSAFLELDIV
jgi:hypothetical protein